MISLQEIMETLEFVSPRRVGKNCNYLGIRDRHGSGILQVLPEPTLGLPLAHV